MAGHNSKEPLATIPASIEKQNIIIGHNSDEISELLHQGNRIYCVCYATNLLNAFGGINKIKIHIGSKHIIAPVTLLDLQFSALLEFVGIRNFILISSNNCQTRAGE